MNHDQTSDYNGPERRRAPTLSEEQMNELAERAAAKAVQKMTDDAYRAVGKTVVDRFLWFVGLIVVAFGAFAAGKGWIKS